MNVELVAHSDVWAPVSVPSGTYWCVYIHVCVRVCLRVTMCSCLCVAPVSVSTETHVYAYVHVCLCGLVYKYVCDANTHRCGGHMQIYTNLEIPTCVRVRVRVCVRVRVYMIVCE